MTSRGLTDIEGTITPSRVYLPSRQQGNVTKHMGTAYRNASNALS